MNPEVVTIGLGYIGLPTSALIASNKTKVLGVDINKNIVDTINKGKIHIIEPDLEGVVSRAVKKGFLKASTKPVVADVYLIVVPTPFKENYQPDITYVQEATESVIPFLKDGDLYIIESTSPVGTTEKMQKLIYSKRPDLKDKIYIAYCPERVLPGNIMYELINNDRVVGGLDLASTNKAKSFYQRFVKGMIHVTNARTAEMCKLVENSSRDSQIAFANELSMICDKANIDVWELLNLANKHPRVNILNPGCGVGGHCIAVDPYFIVSEYRSESKLINKSREINNYKPIWCFEKIQKEKKLFEIKYARKAKIALMGMTFKPNIDDMRESPAMLIVEKVLENSNNNTVFLVEPNLLKHNNFILTDLNYAIEESDIIVFLVAHNQFKNLQIDKNKIVLDYCGVTSKYN